MARKSNAAQERRVKALVCVIGKRQEALLAEVCNDCCVSLHFSAIGYGTAKSNYMSYLGLDEIEKRLVWALIPDYCEAKLLREINRRLRLYLTGNGIAFTIPLSGISNIISNAVLSTPYRDDPAEAQKSSEKGKEKPKKMHELIIAVVNQKYTDAVIDSSRAAGATGATILHTRSVGNKQAEQILGTAFQQETDTVAILTTHEFKAGIMESIRDKAGLKTEGRAVLFSLPVDSLVGIGRSDAEDETV